jgi:hypothetical protein
MRSAVHNALDAHLQALPDLPPVCWENTRFEAPDGVYLRATLLPASREPVNVLAGQSIQRGIGVYQVDVFGPAANGALMGPAVVEQVVDALERHFRPQVALTKDGVTVHIEACESFGAVPGVDRYQIPVSARWRAHETEG